MANNEAGGDRSRIWRQDGGQREEDQWYRRYIELLDRRDAHGLCLLAWKLGYRIKKRVPGAMVLVAGAGPETIGMLLAALHPDLIQVAVAIGRVEERQAAGIPDAAIVSYIRNSMGDDAGSRRPVVILAVTGDDHAILLIKRALAVMNPSRPVIPLSINASGGEWVSGEKIFFLGTNEKDVAINHVKMRLTQQAYRLLFPGMIVEVSVRQILDGSVTVTPTPDPQQERRLRAAVRALLFVQAKYPPNDLK